MARKRCGGLEMTRVAVYTIGNTMRTEGAMSKNLSLKVRDKIFLETEDIIGKINKPRNAYINEALDYYNRFMKRKIMNQILKQESRLVSASSMETLHELELIEDEIPE
jgi:hypothetical protein